MVARQAMQDQEIPDFIEHKQIVAVFDLPENAKTSRRWVFPCMWRCFTIPVIKILI